MRTGFKGHCGTKLLLIAVISALFLYSCTGGGKKERFVKNIADNLRTSYMSELTFNIRTGEKSYDGTAQLLRDMSVTRLDILSPEPFSGLSVEYDTAGAPSSVAVHFAGIDTTLPKEALSRINILASLSADDFLSVLSKTAGENITEYQISEDKVGYCARVIYGEAEIVFCFSEDGNVPYSFEYSSDDINASVVFTKFKLDTNIENE